MWFSGPYIFALHLCIWINSCRWKSVGIIVIKITEIAKTKMESHNNSAPINSVSDKNLALFFENSISLKSIRGLWKFLRNILLPNNSKPLAFHISKIFKDGIFINFHRSIFHSSCVMYKILGIWLSIILLFPIFSQSIFNFLAHPKSKKRTVKIQIIFYKNELIIFPWCGIGRNNRPILDLHKTMSFLLWYIGIFHLVYKNVTHLTVINFRFVLIL